MIGVDFGTTNSCVAIRNAFGAIESIAVATGNRPPYDTVLRSAVLDPELDGCSVGEEALSRAEEAPDGSRLLVSFKPFLDEHQLRRRERQAVGVSHQYDNVEQAEVEVSEYASVWVGGDERYSREELVGGSAALLSQLLGRAIEAGGDLSQLWLGMPVSFSSFARQRLLAALHETRDDRGKPFFPTYRDVLRSVRFVLEPVAVAAGPIMREAYDAADGENVLIFDHGGGTLDLSLLRFDRHPDFEGLVPTCELAASGSREVAGRSLDQAFRESLERRESFQAAARDTRAYLVDQFVESCKIRLSNEGSADALPGVEATREEFERAVAPVLDNIDDLVRGVVAQAGFGLEEVDRVILTGGSSLVPCVQRRVAEIFPSLDEYHLLKYDPSSREDTESAVTEVARGLVAFGDEVSEERLLEHVVLWDLEATMCGQPDFHRIVDRGTRYELDAEGRPSLTRRVAVPPNPGEGTSIGLYEEQLGHRYLFGMADVPPLPAGGVLEVELRPDQVTPAMRLLDHDGRIISRDDDGRNGTGEEDVVADLMTLAEETELEDYFSNDAPYLPVRGFNDFECAPLVRPIRVGDLVEWAWDKDGAGPGREIVRRRGTVEAIWFQGDRVNEMQSLVLEHHRFRIHRDDIGAFRVDVTPHAGQLRLAGRPGRNF